MEQRNHDNILLEIINAVDPNQLSLEAFRKATDPLMWKFSARLHVARMDTCVKTEANIYAPKGRVENRSVQFYPEVGPVEDAVVLTYDKLRNTVSTTTLYPWAGHRWTEEERQTISAIGKLLYTYVSRISMIEFQQKIAFTDQLTGLSNTPGIIRFCEELSKRRDLSEYAGCFMNLKNLKYINRQINNHAGDAAMRQYAMALCQMLSPEEERLARLGGDNFFAVVRKDHLEGFLKLATAMKLELVNGERKQSIMLGAWVGVYPANGGENPRDMLDFASFAYELAKRNKITVTYFNPSMMEASLHARKIMQVFPQALADHELVPFYQPKVSLHTGELYGCEALVRWIRHGKVISPADFVPVAENSDLITQLDLYMLEAVCRDLRGWLDSGLEPVCVSINYSQRDFYRETLVEDTLAILHKYGIDGKYLEIEITETSFFENFSALERFVECMHQNHIRVSLDDFGTGYSSLTMFETLNLDTVKLDRSFFVNTEKKQDTGRLVLHSVASMLNQLNKVTVSEGVETPEQLNLVEEIGCDIVQGYYFDKPLPHDDFTQRLRNKKYNVEV